MMLPRLEAKFSSELVLLLSGRVDRYNVSSAQGKVRGLDIGGCHLQVIFCG